MASTILGRTGLSVSRMGIGPSYGIDTPGVLEAFDRGINFFYFGTLRTSAMASAVRQLTSSDRSKLVIAIQSYARWTPVFTRSVNSALRKLRIEQAEILILGKV